MDKLYIVDRFEGNYIILETPEGNIINIEKNRVIETVEEGDCLIYKDGHFLLDEKSTEKRKQEIAEKMKGMWKE